MYAVIQSGGKQYRVTQGQVVKLEKLELETGTNFQIDHVLMVSNGDQVALGAPFVAGATVKAEVVDHGRHNKIEILKFRRRKHHMKRMGHRQYYTKVRILDITHS